VLVPCCGTFPELDDLIRHFPDREIVGIDLSGGMVEKARERAGRWPNVRVVQGDAAVLEARWTGRCAVVVSAFGLQQLPRPDQALASWVAALRPAGRLSVVFWPEVTEADGPFALIQEVVHGRAQDGNDLWEERLLPALTAQGATVERDEEPSYPIHHLDAAAFFEAYTRHGPLRALTTARLRAEFLRRAPAGELTHHPRARLIVARR
jgi:SAM-dependent methyltransferase